LKTQIGEPLWFTPNIFAQHSSQFTCATLFRFIPSMKPFFQVKFSNRLKPLLVRHLVGGLFLYRRTNPKGVHFARRRVGLAEFPS
jgi:hypothetical protein